MIGEESCVLRSGFVDGVGIVMGGGVGGAKLGSCDVVA